MAKVEYDGYTFDSQEEVDFVWWCEEAQKSGLIFGFSYGLKSMELLGKQNYSPGGLYEKKPKFAFHDIQYTPDFYVECADWFFLEKDMGDDTHVIDVKANFSKHNDAAKFSIIRKLVFHFLGIYVHKIVPDKLFKKTWVPEKCRYSLVRKKLRDKYKDCLTIKQYIEAKNK